MWDKLIRRLRANWFAHWHPDLDAALGLLPATSLCPHDLYRELCTARGPLRKRIAMVTERDLPVAVIGLRRDPKRWAPVTTWMIPGAVFPVEDRDLVRALVALGPMDAPLYVGWWRRGTPPPASYRLNVEAVPTFRLDCTGDYEAYWCQSGLMSDVKRARKRCARLSLEFNRPGAAEWTIKNWGRKWAQDGTKELAETGDKLIVARYWEARGRHITASLLDGDKLIASDTSLVHQGDVVGLTHYREPGYEKLGAGNRLLDAVTQWAAAGGLRKHDFGGGFAYKSRWAPEDGVRWHFTLNPGLIDLSAIRALGRLQVRRLIDRVVPPGSSEKA